MSERIYYSQEAQQQAQRERFALVMLASLFGLSLGTIIAFLFAPQAGDKTRHQLSNQVEHAVTEGREKANRVFDKMPVNG